VPIEKADPGIQQLEEKESVWEEENKKNKTSKSAWMFKRDDMMSCGV
jgi:hypothetical protein